MPDRYWVGGTANWDGTAGTKWATTSGGAGGASVPTSNDNVFFDAASGAVTVTKTGTEFCASCNFTGFTGTFAGSGTLNLFGSLTAVAAMTWTFSGSTVFQGSGAVTFTSAGKTLGPITINRGTGSDSVTLQDALTSSGAITLTLGTFTTNNFNVTASSLSSSNSNTRTINLGSSTVTLSGAGAAITFTTQTNLTFNAGTSTIVLSSPSGAIAVGTGVTFYDVSWTSTAITTPSIQGANTFNNISVTGRTSAGIATLRIDADQTINGTLTLSAGTNATARTFLRSDAIGTTRTLTCAAVASLTDIDFRDITIAGAAAPVSGTRLGDCKGNSGITFDAPKTVWWSAPGGGVWSGTVWSLTNGGATGVNNFPLAQDTAVLPSATPGSGQTVTINAAYNIGTIDMSARTSNTMTLATGSTTPTIYGNWINGTGTTLTGTGTLTFAGRGSQTITSAGKTFTQRITTDSPGGAVTLQDALNTSLGSSSAFNHVSGTFDANGYNVTSSSAAGGMASQGTSTRTLAFGAGTWTLSGTGGFNISGSNLTVTGTGTISMTSASGKSFAGGGIQTYPTINQGGVGTLTITGSNKFANITNTAIGRVQFTGGTTNIFNAFNLSGSVGNLLQLGSTNTIQAILQKGSAWLMGANSTDAGNNTNLSFTAGGGIDYLSVSYINGTVVAPFISATIFESATANSTESSLGTFNPTISELANSSDSVASGAVYIGALAESATAADVVDAIKLYLAEIAESATASDLLAASLTFAAAISELTTASDQTAVASRVTSPTIAEAAQMADSAEGGLFFLSSISESAAPADVASAVLIFNRAVAESATASEIAVAIAAFRAAVSEEVSGADVVNALVTIGGAINEALTALDSVVGSKTTNPTIEEAATASEAQTNVYTANPTIAEITQASDAAQVVASTFSAASAESAVPLDAPQGANTGSSSLSESAAATDTAETAFVASTEISESTTAEDAAAALAEFNGPIIETATALDESSVAPSVFSAVAAAVAAAFDLQNAPGSVYNATLPTEGARASDSLIGAYLWNLIDDSQIPDWTGVLNPQNPGWANIGDEQVPNWQNVDNTQAGTWTAVSDDQTPGWVIIPTSRD